MMMGGAFCVAVHHPGRAHRHDLPGGQLLPLDGSWGAIAGSDPVVPPRSSSTCLIVIALCFAVWATPRSIIATATEIRDHGWIDPPGPRVSSV